jgi:hypothetical protein
VFINIYLILLTCNRNVKSINGTARQQSRASLQPSISHSIYILHVEKICSIEHIEDGKNKEDILQQIKEAKVMFNNKNQILFE